MIFFNRYLRKCVESNRNRCPDLSRPSEPPKPKINNKQAVTSHPPDPPYPPPPPCDTCKIPFKKCLHAKTVSASVLNRWGPSPPGFAVGSSILGATADNQELGKTSGSGSEEHTKSVHWPGTTERQEQISQQSRKPPQTQLEPDLFTLFRI